MQYTYAELHYHTKESSYCGKVSAYDAIPIYRENGYDLVCVTDHYNRSYFGNHHEQGMAWNDAVDIWFAGWHAAKDAGEKHGVKVLHAAEFKFDGLPNDYLVYGVTDEMYYEIPRMYAWTPAQFSEFARKNGIFFSQAHPFRDGMIRTEPTLLDGIEALNSHPIHEGNNHLSIEWAKEHDLIPICGQDYHETEAMVGCKTRFYGDVSDIDTLVSKLFGREYDIVLPDKRIFAAKTFLDECKL
ncbi:MAG: PHP domain-containing protein [Clostridia bacterium]|nr:PHP domain-containing protein [Clostridia bacterium]